MILFSNSAGEDNAPQPFTEVNHCHGPGRGHPCHGAQSAGVPPRLKVRRAEARPDPIRVSDIDLAVSLILQGKVVELPNVKTVSTVLTRLAAMAKIADLKGEKSPDFDLCKVSVPGTNLFCRQGVRTRQFPEGVPRLNMPQMTGVPRPGSEADKLPRTLAGGQIDGAAAFVGYLKAKGITTQAGQLEAHYLKGSQAQLVGSTVAGMMTSSSYDPAAEPIFVSRDNYVVDGHHRWAAVVGRDSADGRLGDLKMKVIRIDAPISEILHEANRWAAAFGIMPKGVKTVHEFNRNHEPAGSAVGGQFARSHGSAPRPALEVTDRIRQSTDAWREKTGNTRKVLAKRVQALYNRSTPEQRRAGGAWYPDAHREAARLAQDYGVTLEQAAGVIAALSPLREWGANKVDAQRLLKSVMNGTADPSIAKLLQANVAKATAIAKGADPRDVLWSGAGYKVRSFYSNIIDPSARETTIDTHMLRVLLADQSIASHAYGSIAGSKGRYDAFRQAIFDVADKAKIPPSEVQAIVWLVQKDEHPSRRSVGSRLKAALPQVPDNQMLAFLFDAVAVLFP